MTSEAPLEPSKEGSSKEGPSTVGGAYSQLLRQQERALRLLQGLKEELEAPIARRTLRTIQESGNDSPHEAYSRISKEIDSGIRAVKACRSEIRGGMAQLRSQLPLEEAERLPPLLARFVANRRENPGFEYELEQDEIRGWIVRWKEYTDGGTVRSSGQLYERPYALLED